MDPLAAVAAIAGAIVLIAPSVVLIITALRTRRDVVEVKDSVEELPRVVEDRLQALHRELDDERARRERSRGGAV